MFLISAPHCSFSPLSSDSLFPLLLFLCHYHVRPATMRLVSRGCWNSTQCSFCSDTETSFLTGDVRDSSRKDGGGKNIVVDVADGSCRCNQTLCGQLVVNGTCWSGNHSYSYDIDLRGKVDEQDPLPLGYRCVTCGDAYAKRTETPGWEYNVTSGVGRCVRSLIVKDDVNDNTGGIIIESNATKPNIIERCVCCFFTSSNLLLLSFCSPCADLLFFFFVSTTFFFCRYFSIADIGNINLDEIITKLLSKACPAQDCVCKSNTPWGECQQDGTRTKRCIPEILPDNGGKPCESPIEPCGDCIWEWGPYGVCDSSTGEKTRSIKIIKA